MQEKYDFCTNTLEASINKYTNMKENKNAHVQRSNYIYFQLWKRPWLNYIWMRKTKSNILFVIFIPNESNHLMILQFFFLLTHIKSFGIWIDYMRIKSTRKLQLFGMSIKEHLKRTHDIFFFHLRAIQLISL